MRPPDRDLARRPHDTPAPLEAPGTIDVVVTVKPRDDTNGVAVILQLAAPARAVAPVVKLKQEFY